MRSCCEQALREATAPMIRNDAAKRSQPVRATGRAHAGLSRQLAWCSCRETVEELLRASFARGHGTDDQERRGEAKPASKRVHPRIHAGIACTSVVCAC